MFLFYFIGAHVVCTPEKSVDKDALRCYLTTSLIPHSRHTVRVSPLAMIHRVQILTHQLRPVTARQQIRERWAVTFTPSTRPLITQDYTGLAG